jgi:DNA helicase-2/ATP-dependent DNA helicase PcrA
VIEANRVWRLIKEARDTLAIKPGGRERNDAIPETLRYRFFADFFSVLKNSLFDPRDVSAQPFANFMLQEKTAQVFFYPGSSNEHKKLVISALHWLYKYYETLLQRERRLDFDDQKLRALCCLQAAPDALATIQRRYDEVIIDEFQDINKLDFSLIVAIAKKARLIVTGDDDQAIYGFRGCSPSYIIDLDKHLGCEVKSFELRRNYRCPNNVVHHATTLIRNNTWRIEKSPVAVRSDNATIKVVQSTTATAEAKMIATAIERIRRKNDSLSYGDFAVLYRTNAQSLPIQLQFILRNIPYNVREEDNILHNEELEKLLGVLRAKLAVQHGAAVRPAVPHGEVYELAASFRGRIDAFVDTIDGALKRAKEEQAGHEENGVVLATVFKAKGLQWHTVAITSCNEGIIPHRRAPIEDERRLFYVALTRASSSPQSITALLIVRTVVRKTRFGRITDDRRRRPTSLCSYGFDH